MNDLCNKCPLGWTNTSRIVGEACEMFVLRYVDCPRCHSKRSFDKCKTNEKAKDMVCSRCAHSFQVKGKGMTESAIEKLAPHDGINLIGGSYKTTVDHLDHNIDYLIVIYDKVNRREFKKCLYVPYENISAANIVSRKPLSSNSRRAGWQGCTLNFDHYYEIDVDNAPGPTNNRFVHICVSLVIMIIIFILTHL